MLPLYRILTLLLAPFWLLALWLKQKGAFRTGERFGALPPRTDRPVWIQAVSVGEVRLALRLAENLRGKGVHVLLTSTTATGLELASRESGDDIDVRAFPLDLGFTMARALKRIRPRCVVLMETELWPVLLLKAAESGTPVLIANGRISDRSMKRLPLLKALFSTLMGQVFVSAQDDEHAERFERIGGDPGRTEVQGNLKYDLTPPEGFRERVEALGDILGGENGQLWVAGSVREGEEGSVLEAHSKLLAVRPQARLILVPRHLDRVRVCLEEARARDIRASTRTDHRGGPWSVLILDTMGDLWAAYDLGRAAFVGGSLVPLGGQNVLEPALLGKPVLFGPHTENFRLEALRLEAAGGAIRVENPERLTKELEILLADPDRCESMGEKARGVVLSHRGALDRTADWILSKTK